MIYLSAKDIAVLADYSSLRHEIATAIIRGAHANIRAPLRTVIHLGGRKATFGAMAACSEHDSLYVVKAGAVVRPNSASGQPTVQTSVTAFCAESGRLLAILDGAAVTALKCRAVTALVTSLCAASDARRAAVIGTGTLALEQVLAITSVRALTELCVYSRDPHHVRCFADSIRAYIGSDPRIVCATTADSAVVGADIVCTATTSTSAVFSSSVRLPGHVHINCVGAHTPRSREVPQRLLRTSTIIVEDVPTAVAEAGSIHTSAMDLTALLRANARDMERRRTIFSSTGHASLDLLSVAHVLRRNGERVRDQRQPMGVAL